MVLFLEMGVREAEEHLRKLPFPNVVGKVLHGICAQNGGILVLSGVLFPQVLDAQIHVFSNLHSDLQTQGELLREERTERHYDSSPVVTNTRQPTIAAAHIENTHLPTCQKVLSNTTLLRLHFALCGLTLQVISGRRRRT